MEIYVFPASPRAIKVMAVANHLGLDWTMRALDPRKGDHMTPEYAALNPNCRMPTFKDGEYVLWESNAIMQHLASKKPQTMRATRRDSSPRCLAASSAATNSSSAGTSSDRTLGQGASR